MATRSVFSPEESEWTEETGGLQSMGSQELNTTERLNTATPLPSPRVSRRREGKKGEGTGPKAAVGKLSVLQPSHQPLTAPPPRLSPSPDLGSRNARKTSTKVVQG